MSKRLFFSAGEASGDAYAAALVKAIRELDGSMTIEGIGGPLLRGEGATMHADSSRWGAISITQSVKVFFRILFSFWAAKRKLAEGEQGVFIPIDFGFVNIKLCKHAKRHGWKVLYFIPPSSWRRDRQGGDLPEIADAIVTPFPWSRDLLAARGANVFWLGHPLLDLVDDSVFDSSIVRRGIAVLPGSRNHELAEHLPILAKALPADEVAEFALAPNLDVSSIKARWAKLAPSRTGDIFTLGDAVGVLRRAKRAVVCSGTATLQAAIAHTPTVLIYRVSRVMQIEAALLGFGKKLRFIGLPNLLLDRMFVPELVGDECEPEAVRHWIERLQSDKGLVATQLEGFRELDGVLGEKGAIGKSAQMIVEMARGS